MRVGADDTADGEIVAELFLRPGGHVSMPHVHPTFRERFTLVSGDFAIRLGRQEHAGEAGRTYEVAPGTAHEFWNAGATEAHLVLEIGRGRRFEEMIKNLFGLAQDGLTNDKGVPGPLQLAVWAREFSDVLYPASPPRAVQRAVLPVLAALARRRGLKGSYQRYRDWEPPAIDVDPWVSPLESALPGPPADSAFAPPTG